MRKTILRVIAILLFPSLVIDQGLAASFAAAVEPARANIQALTPIPGRARFNEQALIAHELFWRLPLLLKRTLSPAVKKDAGLASNHAASWPYLWTGRLDLGLIWMAVEMILLGKWLTPETLLFWEDPLFSAAVQVFFFANLVLHVLIDTGQVGPRKAEHASSILPSVLRYTLLFMLYPLSHTSIPSFHTGLPAILPYLVHAVYDLFQMRRDVRLAWKNRRNLLNTSQPDDLLGRGQTRSGWAMVRYYAKAAFWQNLLFVGWIPWHSDLWIRLTNEQPAALVGAFMGSFLLFRLTMTFRRWRTAQGSETWQGWRTEFQHDVFGPGAWISFALSWAVFLLPIYRYGWVSSTYISLMPWAPFAAAVLGQWARNTWIAIRQGRGGLAVSWNGVRQWIRLVRWRYLPLALVGGAALTQAVQLFLDYHIGFGVILTLGSLIVLFRALTTSRVSRRTLVLAGLLGMILLATPGLSRLSTHVTPFSYGREVFVPLTDTMDSSDLPPEPSDPRAFRKNPIPFLRQFMADVHAAAGQRWSGTAGETRFNQWSMRLVTWVYVHFEPHNKDDATAIQEIEALWPDLLGTVEGLDKIQVDTVRAQLARMHVKVSLLERLIRHPGLSENPAAVEAMNRVLRRLHDERFLDDPWLRRYLPDEDPGRHPIAALTTLDRVLGEWHQKLLASEQASIRRLAGQIGGLVRPKLTREEREDQSFAREDFSQDPYARIVEFLLSWLEGYDEALANLRAAEADPVHHVAMSELEAVREYRRLPAALRTAIRESAARHRLPGRLLVNMIQVNSFRKRNQYGVKSGIEILNQRGAIPHWMGTLGLGLVPDLLLDENLGSAELQNFIGATVGGQSALGMGLVRQSWVRRYQAMGPGSDTLSSYEFARRMLDPRTDIEATAAIYRGGLEDIQRFQALALNIENERDPARRAILLKRLSAMTAPFAREARERTRLMETWETARFIPDAAAFGGEEWVRLSFHAQSGYFVGYGPQGPGHLKFNPVSMMEDQRIIELSGVLEDGKPIEIEDPQTDEDRTLLEGVAAGADTELAAAARRALDRQDADDQQEASEAMQRLRQDFPKIDFSHLTEVPRSAQRISELRQALQTIRRQAPKALALIAAITFTSKTNSHVEGRHIFLNPDHFDGSISLTYAGQYAHFLAETPMSYILEHELSHLIADELRQTLPDIFPFYDRLYAAYLDRTPHETMPYLYTEFLAEDIRNGLFGGTPLNFFHWDTDSSQVMDIRDSLETRRDWLEKARQEWGIGERSDVRPNYDRPWYVEEEDQRPVDVVIQGKTTPIDEAWRDRMVNRIKEINEALPPEQHIYTVELFPYAADNPFRMRGSHHRLHLSPRIGDALLIENDPDGPIAREVIQAMQKTPTGRPQASRQNPLPASSRPLLRAS